MKAAELPPIPDEVVAAVKDFAFAHHRGQTRKTRRLDDGKPHSYAETHLNEVRTRAHIVLRGVFIEPIDFASGTAIAFDAEDYAATRRAADIEDDDRFFLERHPQVVDLIAFCHDLLEDCRSKDCEGGCRAEKPVKGADCPLLIRSFRERLEALGVEPTLRELVISAVQALTKNQCLPKEERETDAWNRLRKQPLWVRLIKFGGDNWHNLRTLAGKSGAKALQNYLKIRRGWEVMFSEDELVLLAYHGLIETPEIMRLRTELLLKLHQIITAAEPTEGAGPWTPVDELNYRTLATADRISGGDAMTDDFEGQTPVFKVVNLLRQEHDVGAVFPRDGERQVLASLFAETPWSDGLIRFFLETTPVTELKRMMASAIAEDARTAQGDSPALDPANITVPHLRVLLDRLGLTGNAFMAMDEQAIRGHAEALGLAAAS